MEKYWKLFLEAVKGEETSFTEWSVKKALFMLAIPVILEMAMESIFAIVDAFFIGQIGSEDAMATIGLTEALMFIVIALAIGISMAATALVSRRVGEKNYEKASESAFQAIILAVFVSIILGVLGFFYSDDILRLMGGSESLVEEGGTYTKILFSLNVILMLLFAINAIFRGAGNASIAMRTLIVANGINIILDPCLIMGYGPFPQMGLTGAAVATCIGRGVGVIYQLYALTNGSSIIRIGRKQFKIVGETLKKLLNLTIGGAGQHLIGSASFIFMIRIVAEFGSEALAGYTIAWRILMFTILPSWGIAMASATLVGQNLGAKQPNRAEESVWMAARYNMYLLIVISLLLVPFARAFVSIFSDNAEVITQGTIAIQIICGAYVIYAYEMVIGQAFNGAGDTYTPTLLNFICFWIIQIPLAYGLAHYTPLGATGVYTAIAISSSCLAFIAIYIFKKGKWKMVEV